MSIVEFIHLALSCILQIALFSLVPFIWWKLTRVDEKFFKWLGFKNPELKGSIWMIIICIIILVSLYIIDSTVLADMTALSESENITSNSFKGMGIYSIIPAFIQNFFQNGVSEELLFRGFLSKRFISKFGFKTGNSIQAFIFGIMHVIPMVVIGINLGLYGSLMLFISTAGSALVLTYLNEKVFGGSILPSILVHGIGNFIFTMAIAFS